VQALDPAGVYANADVIAALTGKYGPRVVSFRFDRLDSSNNYIEPITTMVACSVANNALANIKRTAKFTLRDTSAINYARDRIRPWVRLAMRDGGFVEWPQGVFLLSTPKRVLDPNGITVNRSIDAYDQLQVLTDDKVLTRYTIAASVAYTDALVTLLGGAYTVNITPSASTVPTALDYDPGTSKLAIANDLLGAINYESVTFDENGVLVVKPYQSPTVRPSEYTYATDSSSVITDEIDDTLDLFAIPNVIVLTISEPDQSVLTSTVTNSNPLSPTSTMSRGRSIVDFRTAASAPDQTTLDAQAARAMFDASQVYETVEFTTALMPMHGNSDVLSLGIDGLGLADKFSETAWSYDMVVGGKMKHSVRRVVNV
jgi:hypothetical protein